MTTNTRSWITLLVVCAWMMVTGAGCDGVTDDDTVADDDDTTAADDDDSASDDDDDSAADDDDSAADDDDSAADDDDDATDPYVQPDIYVTPLVPQSLATATVHYFGTYASADNLTLHYGFNGWNQVQGVGPLLYEGNPMNTEFYLEAEMTPVSGGYEVTVDLPDELEVMQFAFYWDDGVDLIWDNNGELDYHWSATFPFIGPYLTWNHAGGPEDGVVVNFETSIPCFGTVEYGTDETLGNAVIGDDFGTMHHIALTGLAPGTTYHYRVLDSAGQVSDVASFSTMPSSPAPLTFAVLSDMQDGGEGQRWTDVVDALEADHQDVQLMVVAGDLAAEDLPGCWWTFFHMGRQYLRERVILPVPGNHDTPGLSSSTDTGSFERYFALPSVDGTAPWYRVDVGDVTFIGLNTEDTDAVAEGGPQELWFDDELAAIAAGGATWWVFGYWHIPPYNAGRRHSDQMSEVQALVDAVDGVVDWVFTGHEHLYQRMVPLQAGGVEAPSGNYGVGPDDGVGYLVLPAAGNDTSDDLVAWDGVDAAYRDWLVYPTVGAEDNIAPSENGYAVITVDGPSITLDVYGLGDIATPIPPYVMDSVAYSK